MCLGMSELKGSGGILIFYFLSGNTGMSHAFFFPGRLVLNVPDSLNMMEEAEGAQDPFFGLMQSHQLLSPYKIHQVQFTIQTSVQAIFESVCSLTTLTSCFNAFLVMKRLWSRRNHPTMKITMFLEAVFYTMLVMLDSQHSLVPSPHNTLNKEGKTNNLAASHFRDDRLCSPHFKINHVKRE